MVGQMRPSEMTLFRYQHFERGRHRSGELPYAVLQFKATREARQRAKETGLDTQIPMVLPAKLLESQQIPEFRLGVGFTYLDFDCLVTDKKGLNDWLGKVDVGDDDYLVVRQKPTGRRILRQQPSNIYVVGNISDSRVRAALNALESSIPYVRQ